MQASANVVFFAQQRLQSAARSCFSTYRTGTTSGGRPEIRCASGTWTVGWVAYAREVALCEMDGASLSPSDRLAIESRGLRDCSTNAQ